MEEELKKDHAEMQAAVDSKQKIIDAQVGSGPLVSHRCSGPGVSKGVTLALLHPQSYSRCKSQGGTGGRDL